jgi:hypothetical protein
MSEPNDMWIWEQDPIESRSGEKQIGNTRVFLASRVACQVPRDIVIHRQRCKEGSRVKKLMALVLIGGSWMLSAVTVRAQTAQPKESTSHVISDQDLNLLRKDLRSKRKQLIAANLKLTETDAGKFWPVYDQYVIELIAINDKKFGLIQDYADNWGKLTNDQSLLFMRQWLDMDITIAQLRQKYVPIVSKVLNGKQTATFFQMDRRIAMMIELQVSSQMPLVQEQDQ